MDIVDVSNRTINENVPIGTYVGASIQALDYDANDALTYSSTVLDEWLSLDVKDGQLKVKENINLQMQSKPFLTMPQ